MKEVLFQRVVAVERNVNLEVVREDTDGVETIVGMPDRGLNFGSHWTGNWCYPEEKPHPSPARLVEAVSDALGFRVHIDRVIDPTDKTCVAIYFQRYPQKEAEPMAITDFKPINMGRLAKAPKRLQAPAPAEVAIDERAGEILAELPLSKVVPSKTNPRKHISPEELEKLAASIQAHGLLQRILVRPVGPVKVGAQQVTFGADQRFEIIAGERRFRAHQLAKLSHIKVTIRVLADREAFELQVVENDQREDLSPRERAAAYQRLINEHGQTVDQVAERIGRSVSTIRSMLHLLKVPPAVEKALDAGELSWQTASLIGRLPNAKTREEVGRLVLEPDYRDEQGQYHYETAGPLSVRDTQDLIGRKFLLQLKQAPFSQADKTLLPGAGSCKDCPKRTGNNRLDFPDGRADMCTDPACYREKVLAHQAKQFAVATAAGQKVLPAAEAEKVFKQGGLLSEYGHLKYLSLDCPIWTSGAKSNTLRDLLKGKLADDVVLAHDAEGRLHELVNRKEALALVKPERKSSGANGHAHGHAAPREIADYEVRRRAVRVLASAAGVRALAQIGDLGKLDPLAVAAIRLAALAVAGVVDESWYGGERRQLLTDWFPGLPDNPRPHMIEICSRADARTNLSFLLFFAAAEFAETPLARLDMITPRDDVIKTFTSWTKWADVEKQARKELEAERKTKDKPPKQAANGHAKNGTKKASEGAKIVRKVAAKDANPVVKGRLEKIAKDLDGKDDADEPPAGLQNALPGGKKALAELNDREWREWAKGFTKPTEGGAA